MALKLILRWDIKPEYESEYSDFVANEFIPNISKLGLVDIQVWYTVYGDCEQILVSGNTQTKKQMHYVLSSDEWDEMRERLMDLVEDLHMKVVPATGNIQR